MNMKAFNASSQNFIGNLLSSSTFNLENRDEFEIIKEPYDLNGTKYQIYSFRKLTGYLPDPEKKDEPVLYTFYIVKIDQDTKDIYLREVNKMRSKQDYDKEIISNYYLNFVPSFKPFDELTYSLGKMLEEDFFPEKEYRFIFSMGTVTKDNDLALVYTQLSSLAALDAKYPGDVELPFKI